MRRAAATVLTMLALLGTPAHAGADRATQSRLFDELARSAYQRGRYRQALELFLLAQEAAPSPRGLYNIALCAQQAGLHAEAYTFFEEYVRWGDDDPRRFAEARRRLEELREKLTLVQIDSDPPRARIYIDARDLGSRGRTPRTLPVSPGRHEVILVREKHVPARTRFEVEPGQRISLALELERRTGIVEVHATPADATVVVLDGKRELARGSAAERFEVPVGTHLVRLEAPGHEAAVRRVTVSEEAPTIARLVAKPVRPPTGRLLVHTGEVHARLWLDGERQAETPATIDEVSAGEHEVRLRAPGYRRWEGDVTITESEASYLNVTLLPKR